MGGEHLTRTSKHSDGKKALLAGLVIAANALHLERTACIRACRGVPTMPAIGTYASCEVFVRIRGNSTGAIWFYTPEAGDLGKIFPARALAQEALEFDRAQASWTEVCVVRFLSVARHSAIKAAPQVPLLAGAGLQRHSSCPQGQPDDGGVTQENAAPTSKQGTDVGCTCLATVHVEICSTIREDCTT